MDDKVSALEAYTAVKEHEDTFYSVFFDADAYYPPTVVRVLIIGTYISLFSLFGLMITLGVNHLFLNGSLASLIPTTTIEQYTELNQVKPIYVIGLLVASLFVSIYIFSMLASKISLIYEEPHIKWVEEIQPNRDVDSYYPPYEYWAEEIIDENYLKPDSIPTTAPPELRELTRYEKARNWGIRQTGRLTSFLFLVLTFQMVTLLNQMYGNNIGPIRNR